VSRRGLRLISEADTCRKYVVPKLHEAGWSDDQIIEQKYFTDGRIVVVGKKHTRKPGKKADYLLYYKPNYAIAVVEAKAAYSCFIRTQYFLFHLFWQPANHICSLTLQF